MPPKMRSDEIQINEELKIISNNPVVNCLIHSISGLFAVLDENRQIVAVNDSLLKLIDADMESVIGLRLGESIKCIHAHDTASGCGTTKYCQSCGAAIAMSSSLTKNTPIESKCVAQIHQKGTIKDVVFKVKCNPVIFQEQRFILIFIQDITQHEMRAKLEDIFFHDINNILTGIIGTASMADLYEDKVDKKLLKRIEKLAGEMEREIHIQKMLLSDNVFSNNIEFENIEINTIIEKLHEIFPYQTDTKQLVIPEKYENSIIYSDLTLILRILNNMIKNALEASEDDDVVRVSVEKNEYSVIFAVWNKQVIPKKYQYRIFERHFTTKKGSGHGFGTFSMKLLAEKYLHATVDFASEKDRGTTFCLCIPHIKKPQ